MANFNRKITTADNMIQLINKFNALVDYAYCIDDKITTVHKMVLNLHESKAKVNDNEKENSHDRYNFIMECAYEIQKTCSECCDCADCPFYNLQSCDCMINDIRPDRWSLKSGDENG